MRILIVIEGDTDATHHKKLAQYARKVEETVREYMLYEPKLEKITAHSEFLPVHENLMEDLLEQIAEADGIIFMQYVRNGQSRSRLPSFVERLLKERDLVGDLELERKAAGLMIVGGTRDYYAPSEIEGEKLLALCNQKAKMRLPPKSLAVLRGRWPREHRELTFAFARELHRRSKPRRRAARKIKTLA